MTLWTATEPVRVIVESGPESLWTQWGGLLAVLVGAIVGGVAQAWAGWLRSRHELRDGLREKRYELYVDNLRASRNLDLALGDYARAIARPSVDASTDVAEVTARWEDAVRVWTMLYPEVDVFASRPMQDAQAAILHATHTVVMLDLDADSKVLQKQVQLVAHAYVRVLNIVRADLGVDALLGTGKRGNFDDSSHTGVQ